jgi:small GTP-binding protein
MSIKGHIDFTYEVSRSLKACQGCILVVDVTQGVQAQTIANFFLAFEAGIQIIPVLNKIDLKTARIEDTMAQMKHTMDFDEKDMIKVSAKTGFNCEKVLDAIVEKIST